MNNTVARRAATAAALLLVPLSVAPLTPVFAATCGAPLPSTATLTVAESTVVPGAEMHLSGSGFEPGQRLAVKVDRDAYGQLGADLAESAPEAVRDRIEVGPDGTFSDEAVVMPTFQLDGKVTEGGEHTVNLLDNDPVTTVCAVFSTDATYTSSVDVSAAAAPGDSVVVSGTGWTDRAGTASSTVAVVVEEVGTTGIVASERLPEHRPVESNARIWDVVPASAFSALGTFTHTVTLPDGSTTGPDGSTVAFGGKRYRIRLWSGSQLQNATDITRNVQLPEEFDVSAPFAATTAGTITGKLAVGRTLRATAPTWNRAVDEVAVQWLRDGSTIAKATGATYTLVRADKGATISVRHTATAGEETATSTSSATARIKPGKIVVKKKAKIKGKKKVKVGKKLQLTKATFNVKGVKAKYQWLRNGKAIKKKAKKASYKTVKADKGKKIRVRITYTKPGHKKVVRKTNVVRVR